MLTLPPTTALHATALLIWMPVICGLCPLSVVALAGDGLSAGAASQDSTPPRGTYSDTVVEKANQILFEAELRRSGKSLQSTRAAELSRLVSGIARSRRELQLQQNSVADSQARLTAYDNEIEKLQHQEAELNLQLATVAGLGVTKNNRVAGLINASVARIRLLRKQRDEHQKVVEAARAQLNTAEEEYSESVFQVRKQVDAVRAAIDKQMQDDQVQIAMAVMHTNFDVSAEIDGEQVLDAIESRLRDFEKEVVQENIALESSRGGVFFVMASVNQHPVRMVIDSGATHVLLPADAAAEMEVDVPSDAPVFSVTLGNGETTTGRGTVIASVRIGQFEAKDVAAVVLDPTDQKVTPLLGMSYLNRYRFELDSPGKTLGLTRVDQSDSNDATSH